MLNKKLNENPQAFPTAKNARKKQRHKLLRLSDSLPKHSILKSGAKAHQVLLLVHLQSDMSLITRSVLMKLSAQHSSLILSSHEEFQECKGYKRK